MNGSQELFPTALLAAALTALTAVILQLIKSRLEARERSRQLYAEAYRVYTTFKEFPYAIRRRRVDEPETERIRLSEALREVQAQLSYYVLWTALEDCRVGDAYKILVAGLRRVAGASMRDAWLEPGAANDVDMNFPPGRVDLSELNELERRFVDAVHMSLRPWWKRGPRPSS